MDQPPVPQARCHKGRSGNFTVVGQSLQAGTWWPCASGITGELRCDHPEPGADAGADAHAVALAVANTDTRPDRRRDADTDCHAAADSHRRRRPAAWSPRSRDSPSSAARAKWTAAGLHRPLHAGLRPDQQDRDQADHQPGVDPGDCIPPNSSVTVTHS